MGLVVLIVENVLAKIAQNLSTSYKTPGFLYVRLFYFD